MSDKRYHVTIVGGGITGLTAAFYLQKAIDNDAIPLDFTLVEAGSRLGGKVQTDYYNGFVMEKGPDSFLERKRSAAELVKDLGMQDELVRNKTGRAYILQNDRLHPIPEGAVMGIPTKVTPFIRSSLFSMAGKVRAAADLWLPRSEHTGDQSVGHFFRHRLGDDVVDHLIEPLLSGIYAGNIDALSLKSTFPQFAQLEQQYRSLILAMRQTRTPNKANGKPKGQFLTLRQGLQSLVDTIEQRLPAQSVLKNTALLQIERQDGGYHLYLDNDKTIATDAVILAIPSHNAQHALTPYVSLQPISSVPATSVANVVLAYPDSAIKLEQEGTGFVVPRTAAYTITACTWTHKKWPHTTPQGKALLRCYIGRAGDDGIVDETDDKIVRTVISDLRRVQSISADPDFYRITRWKKAMPQYAVGHQSEWQNVREQLERNLPGIVLAGASYEGVGLPDCINQGKKAVNDVMGLLFGHS